jgi:hypothetical protein
VPYRRRSVSRVATALLLGATASAPLRAQATSGVTIGDVSTRARIRVATREAQSFVGTLLRRAADTLVVELPSGAALTIPEARLARLDVSAGVQRRTWQGAGIGFLAGAGIGSVVALATYHRTKCVDSAIAQGFVCPLIDDVSRQTTVIVDAALIATAGSIVGALIGHVGHETWIPVLVADVHGGAPSSAHRVGLALPISNRAIGLGVSAAF